MITIALGDTHGRDTWKTIVEKETFDKVVLIGDYFDSFYETAAMQMYNFKEIIAYKKAHPDKVVLLVGNHDFHYLREIDERYSGFQARHRIDIAELLHDNLQYLQMCYIDGKYCFTHAGITKTFLELNNIKDDEHLEKNINKLFTDTPSAFKFNGYDPYGDNITQSPIWVRPRSLLSDAIDRTHVVGHTEVIKLGISPPEASPVILIDTLDTTGEYLKIEDDVLTIKNYKTL